MLAEDTMFGEDSLRTFLHKDTFMFLGCMDGQQALKKLNYCSTTARLTQTSRCVVPERELCGWAHNGMPRVGTDGRWQNCGQTM